MTNRVPSDRFARHRLIQGFSQEALQSAHIAVVGAGAIGNEVVKNLALLGVGKLTLVDFDQVEVHNLTRSVLLREADIGQAKAQVVAQRAAELSPGIQIDAIAGDVRDHLGLSQLAACDAVIAAVDNVEARLWLNQLCRLAGKLFIQAGIDHRYCSVERFPFASGTDCACYACNLPEGVYLRLAQRYSCGGLLRAALHERIVPTTVTTASLAGAQAAWQALRDLPDGRFGAPGTPLAQRWFWDSYEGTAARSELGRRQQCLSCGDAVALPASRVSHSFGVKASQLLALISPATGILLPEPVLTGIGCTQCGEEQPHLLGQSSRRHTEGLIFCRQCQHASVRIDSREVLDFDTLVTLGNAACTIQASYAWLIDAQGNKSRLLDFSAPAAIRAE